MKRAFVLLLAAATAFEALRAGAGTFRMILDLPARARIGDVAFTAFSKATDLSPAGVIFYVVFGVGGALVTGTAFFAAIRARAPRAVRWLTGLSLGCSLLILGFTTQAAPLIWRAAASPPDPRILEPLLDRFAFWTDLRILLADLSFAAMLSALTFTALSRQGGRVDRS